MLTSLLRSKAAFVCRIALCVMVLSTYAAAETCENVLLGSIEAAAHANSLSSTILSRLLWVESRFHPAAVSAAGAQGVAQFMPATAAERGLMDPFSPEQAIPQAAKLLAELTYRFGNIGMGLAAYNAGPGRIARWLDGAGYLPDQTRHFVTAITGRSPEEWAAQARFIGCRFCSVLGTPHKVYPGSERTDLLPILRQSGRSFAVFEESGRLLPILQRSGRPFP
jgi:hypothetical protein